MRTAHAVAVAALGIVLVAALIPAVAQPLMGMMPNAGTGCGGMMQSMNGGGRPDSRWRTHAPGSGWMVN